MNDDLPKIDANIKIEELIDYYPQVVDFLVQEYGFFCFNCFLAGYERLQEGAKAHGIEGDEFQEMLENIDLFLKGELEL